MGRPGQSGTWLICKLLLIWYPRIWDTAGQEDYARVRKMAYPGTDVLLIGFNVMERASFDNAYQKWFMEDFKKNMPQAKVTEIIS